MPNFYDFGTLDEVKTIKINPKGWVNPLTIEYGFADLAGITCLWRIKGTKHTFSIPILRLNFVSSGDYAKHFTEVLERFKETDYDSWREKQFAVQWMREYEAEYRNYIL